MHLGTLRLCRIEGPKGYSVLLCSQVLPAPQCTAFGWANNIPVFCLVTQEPQSREPHHCEGAAFVNIFCCSAFLLDVYVTLDQAQRDTSALSMPCSLPRLQPCTYALTADVCPIIGEITLVICGASLVQLTAGLAFGKLLSW